MDENRERCYICKKGGLLKDYFHIGRSNNFGNPYIAFCPGCFFDFAGEELFYEITNLTVQE